MDRIALAVVASLAFASCDRSSLPLDDGGVADLAPAGPRDLTPPPPDYAAGCGDGVCGPDETCTNCPVDCGLCSSCGDHTCEQTETCGSCPEDCGSCPRCGDGYCTADENCETCAPDCGPCARCGDGHCAMPDEDCFTCPQDCGACQGCGDGKCTYPETCASCEMDCGVCAVCGNMKCEAPYETCVNCPSDCGDCMLVSCGAMLTCALGCIDLSTTPPTIMVSCVATCVAKGCPSSQYFFDQAFNCLIDQLVKGGGLGGAMQACGDDVKACFAAKCK